MPTVNLTFDSGRAWRDSGGCFGFAGRSGRATSMRGEAIRFDYEIGNNNIASVDYPTVVRYLAWLTAESPWSKFFFPLDGTVLNPTFKVGIHTEHQGHAVIGCASLARLVYHKPKLVKFALDLKDEGIDMTLALLISYSFLGSSGRQDLNLNTVFNLSGSLGLGDDEPMNLSRLGAGDIYSMLAGNFDFHHEEGVRNYSTTLSYGQYILRSYRTVAEPEGFTAYLTDRINKVYASPTILTSSTSRMGSTTQRTFTSFNPSLFHGLTGYEIKGLAHTLNRELKTCGKLLGFGSAQDFVL